MPDTEVLSLAEFARQVCSRASVEPPCGRSPDLLVVAVARVAAIPGSMRSRVLGRLLAALSQDTGTFDPMDIHALDGETLGIAAELIEGRLNGWFIQREWDEVRELVEAVEVGAM